MQKTKKNTSKHLSQLLNIALMYLLSLWYSHELLTLTKRKHKNFQNVENKTSHTALLYYEK